MPDSEICGSTLTYNSPQLIAVNRVLRRLSAPRHPPPALCSLFAVFASRRPSRPQRNPPTEEARASDRRHVCSVPPRAPLRRLAAATATSVFGSTARHRRPDSCYAIQVVKEPPNRVDGRTVRRGPGPQGTSNRPAVADVARVRMLLPAPAYDSAVSAKGPKASSAVTTARLVFVPVARAGGSAPRPWSGKHAAFGAKPSGQVEPRGIEPPTPGLQSRCSPN